MSVDSPSFLAFIVIVFVVVRLAPSSAVRHLLLCASILYYATFNATYAGFTILFVLLNYAAARTIVAMPDSPARDRLFTAAVVFDVGILVWFRWATLYYHPPAALQALSLRSSNETLLYPLGLSFLVIQLLGSLADVYRGTYDLKTDGTSFLLFGMFFPKMTSGPIPKAGDLLPQLDAPKLWKQVDYAGAAHLIVSGLFKKLVVANRLDIYVKTVFTTPLNTGGDAVLLAFVLNALQLYADFSGYTDIARGVALLFLVKLPENFNNPFLAESVTDFWRRWHIPFSTWLRDNLYMPIVILLRDLGAMAFILAFLITFVLCGLWHGTSWNFVLFGVIHGTALSVEFLTKRARSKLLKKFPGWLTTMAGRIYVFLIFVISQVLFRTASLQQAMGLARKASGPVWAGWAGLFGYQGPLMFVLLFIALACWIVFWTIGDMKKTDRRADNFAWLHFAMALSILVIGKSSEGNFIYAQF